VLTLLTSNGQAPFVTVFMYLGEAKNEQERKDLALIIEETLEQRCEGVKNEDGEVIRYSSAGAESTFLFASTPEREQMAWEFVKWWSSAGVQAEFGQRLQITYGDEYYWNPANAEAFAQLPWDSDDKEVILTQLEWTLEAPRALASYMVERELSDAYNLVVLGAKSASVRESLDDAQKSVKRETQRKLEEFGYVENGVMVKEYEVQTVEKVREIIAKSKEAK